MTTPKNIFISHATLDDDPLVNDIAKKFQLEKHTTWVDHHGKIPPGTPDWDKAIRQAIVACDVGVLVMTENSLNSTTCGEECLLIQQLGKPLYIIHAEKCKPENVWLYIKKIQYADVVAPRFDVGMDALIRAINGDTDPTLPTAYYPQITGMSDMTMYLPYLRNPLRGRHADVQILLDYLAKGGVTQLIGVGGLGKSRISAEIALAHKDGAVWHRCSNITKREDVEVSLRTHLLLQTDAPIDLIIRKMAERQSLLVIDNAEDVSANARVGYMGLFNQLADYGVPILLTAREQWQSTPSLTFLSEKHPLQSFTDADLDIATQMTHDFYAKFGKTFTDDEAKQLAKSGRFHPKLIEFAVGLIAESGHSYDTIIKRLDELIHDDIQQALDEMITKTLEQMRDVAKYGKKAYDLIHNLTWLQATFPIAVIEALKPASILTDDDLLDALVTLKRYQFLRDADVTKERYRLVELVRETLKPPTDPELFNIYADFYTLRAMQIFDDTPPQDWHDNDEGSPNADDILNIKAVGAVLMTQTANGTQGDLRRALNFAYATTQYVNKRMEAKVWDWLEMGLSAVQASQKNKPDDITLKNRLALFLNEIGLYYALGHKDKALAYYEQALPIMREVGNRSGEATVLNNMGGVYAALKQKDKALAYYEQALPIYREVGDRSGEATSLNNMGDVYYALEQKDKALAYYEQALPIMREVGDRRGEATSLNNIGKVYKALGDMSKGLAYYEQALPIYREVGDRSSEATSLNNMGDVYYALEQKDKALAYYEQALPIYREVGDRSSEATSLNNMGSVYDALGQKDKALATYEQALPIYREVGDRSGEATTLNNIGTIYYALKEFDKTVSYMEQALAIFVAIDAHPYVVTLQVNIGVLMDEMGRLDEVIAHQEDAIRIMKERQLVRTGAGDTLQQLEQDLAFLKGKKGGGGNLPSETLPPPEEEYNALMKQLADIYKKMREAGLRQMLTESNVPEAQIEEIVAVVIAQVAGEGGNADDSPDMLPFETIREWVSNTYAVLKRDTHQIGEWREQLEGAKSRMAGMGDEWGNEVQFVEALLAVLRGESPVMPVGHPYHEPIQALLEGLKG